MGPYVETKESAAPTLLVLSQEAILVRITLCGVDSTYHGLTAIPRVQPGEPVAGNPLGGFCEGGRAQATWSQDSSLPTIAGFFFIRWNLPETKGKTLEEIEGTWDRSARDDAPGA